jgi:hypothetical protein
MSQDVPSWVQLPSDVQRDFSSTGFTQQWFEKQPETIRLTLLNLYVKMSRKNLWRHVRSGRVVIPGTIEFQAKNVLQLKQELTDRQDFGSPGHLKSWNSGEKTEEAMLHFKHDKAWTNDPTTVWAHIDPVGWSADLVSIVRHWANYSGYKDPYRIRNVLLRQNEILTLENEDKILLGNSPQGMNGDR